MAVFVVNDEAQDSSTVDAVSFFASVDRAVAKTDDAADETRVAFDCEGVNLSRIGSIELISLCFSDPETSTDEVFVVDVGEHGDAELRKNRLAALKQLMECKSVTKIIHDCRMDCDALYHHCDILVHNVHDTSCFHAIITGMEDKNLNDFLSRNGISKNERRDKSVYQRNPAFWAERPLSARMIDWAASDVDKLIILTETQLANFDSTESEAARAMSTKYATMVKDKKVERGMRCHVSIGRFIGPGGSNLRDLQKRTGTLLYQEDRNRADSWFVFYDKPSDLRSVKSAMGYLR